MLIFIVLSLAYAQMQDEQQLTNAACVIFSRYYLQSNQELAGRTVGEMIHLQQLTKDDAVMFAVASLVESCLDNISTQETMEIIQELQQQKINLEAHQHLVEKADIKKYGSKKKSSKKNEILKIIKSIDDMVSQQKREHEGGDDGGDQSDGQGRKRQRNRNKQQELPDMSIFELKEWLVLSSFVLVGVLLSYIICCVPERKKKDKKQKNKVKSKEQDDDKLSPKKEQEISSEEESQPQEVAENKEKKKAE